MSLRDDDTSSNSINNSFERLWFAKKIIPRKELSNTCCGLTPASNQSPHSCSLTPHPWDQGQNWKAKS